MVKADSVPKQVKANGGEYVVKDTTHYIYDTTKTLCTYMVNLATGECPTAYLIRISKSRMDFVSPTSEELKKDSLILKKQKVILQTSYFMSIPVLDKDTKKGEKPKYHVEYAYMPNDVIIKDYGGNLDYVLKQIEKEGITVPKDSTDKKIVKPKKK